MLFMIDNVECIGEVEAEPGESWATDVGRLQVFEDGEVADVKGSVEIKEDDYDEGTRVRSKQGGHFYDCSFTTSGLKSQTEESTMADWSGDIVEMWVIWWLCVSDFYVKNKE